MRPKQSLLLNINNSYLRHRCINCEKNDKRYNCGDNPYDKI